MQGAVAIAGLSESLAKLREDGENKGSWIGLECYEIKQLHERNNERRRRAIGLLFTANTAAAVLSLRYRHPGQISLDETDHAQKQSSRKAASGK